MTYRGAIRNKFGANKNYASVGFSINALNYYGDLSPTPKKISTDISLTKPGAGITYTYRMASRLSLQGGFMYGNISGSDIKSADKTDTDNGIFRFNRDLSFRNRIKELSLVVVIDYYENQSFYIDRAGFTPYVFFGIAVFHHNPQAQVPGTDLQGKVFANAGEWVDLNQLGTEGQLVALTEGDANYGIKPYKLTQPAIPFGIGIRARLNNQLDVSTEFSFRYLFTDYIDDVSRNYLDLGTFGNNELAKALSYRTNEIATPNYQYTSERDGKTYSVLAGYGHEYKDNVRGNRGDKDFYTVFTLRFSYIIVNLPGNRPKYR